MHRPDDLDSRIIRELVSTASPQWDVRVSYARIARKLGVDEETVRRRLKKAKEKGALPGWKLLVNPCLLGCAAAVIRLGTQDSTLKPLVLSQLLLLEGVVIVVDFRGPTTFVELNYASPDELQRRVELMSTIARSPNPSVWRTISVPADITMRPRDWKIVRGLMEDARRDLREVAAQVRVSRRTVERRLEAMKDSRAVYLAAQPNFDAMAGVVCALIVGYSSVYQKQEGDRWLLSEIRGVAYVNAALERRTVLTFFRENLAECEKVLEMVREGVQAESVRMETIRRLTVSTRWQAEKVRTLEKPE